MNNAHVLDYAFRYMAAANSAYTARQFKWAAQLVRSVIVTGLSRPKRFMLDAFLRVQWPRL
jgi:hypothetical protein